MDISVNLRHGGQRFEEGRRADVTRLHLREFAAAAGEFVREPELEDGLLRLVLLGTLHEESRDDERDGRVDELARGEVVIGLRILVRLDERDHLVELGEKRRHARMLLLPAFAQDVDEDFRRETAHHACDRRDDQQGDDAGVGTGVDGVSTQGRLGAELGGDVDASCGQLRRKYEKNKKN